ncbi:Peptidyl-prolyl isomerase cwc27 [Coemansia erecta]|nr:Peptidyl-prolyl isomerase cwc27 [Coemansia erecta]
MSSIYVSEPPTSGKVVLETTAGDIEIELWSKEAPKASRNFVQLCLEGYYDSTIFHRVVPGWIVQGGDPTGTGEEEIKQFARTFNVGGVSIYGAPFSDEFHSRLRFNRRGILGMANAGPNNNGSQFFITLAPTPELQKKNTMFGIVVGQSLFTALKLGEGETDKATERPVHPRSIISARVLDNPFPDILPRPRSMQASQLKDGPSGSVSTKRKKLKVVNNKKLLSFADEDSDDDEDEAEDNSGAGLFSCGSRKNKSDAGSTNQYAKRRFNMKSSHDLLDSDPMLSSTASASPMLPSSASVDAKQLPDPIRAAESHAHENVEIKTETGTEKTTEKKTAHMSSNTASANASNAVRSEIKKVECEISKITDRERKRKLDSEASGRVSASDANSSKSALSEMLAQYRPSKAKPAANRKKDKAHEDRLLERLSSFQSKIRKTKGSEDMDAAPLHGESVGRHAKCKLHSISDCKSCQPNEPDEYGGLEASASKASEGSWLSHRLQFSNSKEQPSASEYAPRVEDYVVIDPREQEQKFLRKAKQSKKY